MTVGISQQYDLVAKVERQERKKEEEEGRKRKKEIA
jgi:hypothetical protein